MTRRPFLLPIGAALLATGSLLWGAPEEKEKEKTDCAALISRLEAAIAHDPSRVLMGVEDALTVNEKCACEIVKTAITASKADPRLVGEIVVAGVNAAPAAASTIGECALAAAPNAGSEIKKAMETALGQKPETAPSGKEPIAAGKQPVVTEKKAEPAPEDDFGGGAMDFHGIYLSSPASSGAGLNGEEEVVIKRIRTTRIRIKVRPPSGGTPATGS